MNRFPVSSIADLLAVSSVDDRQLWLDAAGFTGEAGLTAVLETAAMQMNGDPAQAIQLVRLVAALAPATSPLSPRIDYLEAQYAAMQADFETAARLIERAAVQYRAQGDVMSAVRTTAGLMQVLSEQGAYQKAIVIADEALVLLAQIEQSAERDHIVATLYRNQGYSYIYLGDPDAALATIDAAAPLIATSTFENQIAFASIRGLALHKLGSIDEAIALNLTVLEQIDKAVLPFMYARYAGNIALLYAEAGQYAASLNLLEETENLLAASAGQADLYRAYTFLGDVWRALNLYPEALQAYRQAETGLRASGILHQLGLTLRGLGIVLARTGQREKAIAALEEAIMHFEQVGNQSQVATTLIELSAMQLVQGDLRLASDNLTRAEQLTEANTPLDMLAIRLAQVDVALAAESVSDAAVHLAAAQALVEQIGIRYLTYRVAYRRGRIAQRTGDVTAAISAYERAIALIEEMRVTLPSDAMRAAFLDDKLAPWNDLIDLYLSLGDEASLQKAFALVDQARARSLVDMMVGSVDRQLESGLSAAAAQTLQALQAQLNAIYNDLFDPNSEQRGAFNTMRARAIKIEHAIKQIRHRAAAAQPPLAAALPFASLSEQLPTDLPILAWHTHGDEIMAFIYQDGALTIKRHVTTISTITPLLAKMNSHWNRMRAGQQFATRHHGRLLQAAQRILHQLHDALIAPLHTALPTTGDLVIIPHHLLHHVPFHALYDGAAYLLDRLTISYAPSVSVFALCQQRETAAIEQSLVVGVSDLSLVHVEQEMNAIRPMLPRPVSLLDEAATHAQLNERLPQTDLLHIASHALFRSDNPRFSAVRLHDSWMTARDISEWQNAPSHVTLSACESGRSVVMGGDETIGLTRAFLSAGTQSLVVSLWLVQDETAAHLMPVYYQHLQTAGSAAALQAAQIKTREQYPHPWFWASFVAVGKRKPSAPSALSV